MNQAFVHEGIYRVLRSTHDQEAFQVHIQVPQEVGVLFPKVAAEIVFTLK
jgi:hypothetical protein